MMISCSSMPLPYLTDCFDEQQKKLDAFIESSNVEFFINEYKKLRNNKCEVFGLTVSMDAYRRDEDSFGLTRRLDQIETEVEFTFRSTWFSHHKTLPGMRLVYDPVFEFKQIERHFDMDVTDFQTTRIGTTLVTLSPCKKEPIRNTSEVTLKFRDDRLVESYEESCEGYNKFRIAVHFSNETWDTRLITK